MSTAETSRRDDAVRAARYWLTEAGVAVTDEWWTNQKDTKS